MKRYLKEGPREHAGEGHVNPAVREDVAGEEPGVGEVARGALAGKANQLRQERVGDVVAVGDLVRVHHVDNGVGARVHR